ncbi:hypothetical protein BH11ACT6_BH11ACT6_24340 [soil metagenome]
MDANDLAAFRYKRRNRKSAWGPRSSAYPVAERRANLSKKD